MTITKLPVPELKFHDLDKFVIARSNAYLGIWVINKQSGCWMAVLIGECRPIQFNRIDTLDEAIQYCNEQEQINLDRVG